jgi:8-oxo-dGTP pyrophosphatase MutT (NUDIX family)
MVALRWSQPMTDGPDLDQLRATLGPRGGASGREPSSSAPAPEDASRRASVALVFAGPAAALRLCLIRRAERLGDPWSGQMALPGGFVDASDASDRAAAKRETREEVGVDLADAEYLGALGRFPMVADHGALSPFAFYLGVDLAPLVPEAKEVAAAFWLEVGEIWAPERLTTVPYVHEGTRLTFPGIAFGPDVIWGLTYRVLTDLGRVVGRPLGDGRPVPGT